MSTPTVTEQAEEIEKLAKILKGQLFQYESLGGGLAGPTSANVKRTIGIMKGILDEIEKNH